MTEKQLVLDVEEFLEGELLAEDSLGVKKDLNQMAENLGDLLIKEDKTKGNLVVISSFIKKKHPPIYVEFYEELLKKSFLRHERSFNIVFFHTIFGFENSNLLKLDKTKPTFLYFTDVKDSDILEFIRKFESFENYEYLAFSEMPSVIGNIRYYSGRPEWFIHLNKADLFKKME
ncbi:TPA: hypothetical protein DIC38_02730 [Candidatus Nomurabacteria bacterium]|nr:MAG: hypothetical protein O210_OD1C00001G0053 [Parcubacteria bacterium RAAC4_OD1_1]HCY26568.1 hypothetical protein [Candidatus Nomurabacteria bacterium]